MSNSQYNEQDELQKYLEEKAKQEQEQEMKKEQEAKQLSAYEACVLKESARIHELISKAQKKTNERLEDE